jgi:hypothetical protein
MVEKLNFNPLQVVKAIKRTSIWWGFSFKGLEFGLSIPTTQELYKSNLLTFGDLWRVEIRDFHSWDELKFLFLSEEGEYNCWQWLINNLLECWIKELKQLTFRSCDGEWLGIYNDETTSNPIGVFCRYSRVPTIC